MSYKVFFDNPSNYANRFDFYSCGSSPLLIEQLLRYIDDNAENIEEINIALYLYNNKTLNDKIVSLSEKNIRTNIYTIPIEGYDNKNPKDIIDINTRRKIENASKYDLAKKIFTDYYRSKIKNINLYFFPHVYLRSAFVKKFSRGNMPYSLHAKTFMFKHKNGKIDTAISSSNFAVRDLVKYENLLFILDENDYSKPVLDFFNKLNRHSIHITKYNFKGENSKYRFHHTKNINNTKCGFMAPYYKDASFEIENFIKHIIANAKKRIILVGQHVCPIDYRIDSQFHSEIGVEECNKRGFIHEIIERASSGVEVNFLTQTFASGNKIYDRQFRFPVNTANFIKFYKIIKEQENITYIVNENCHSKYIVIDDSVFVSTFNYTPTQFIYLDKVKIYSFKYNPDKSYEGVYSEVGQYVLINDNHVVEEYVKNYDIMKADDSSVKVI